MCFHYHLTWSTLYLAFYAFLLLLGKRQMKSHLHLHQTCKPTERSTRKDTLHQYSCVHIKVCWKLVIATSHASVGCMTGESCSNETPFLLRLGAASLAKKTLQVIIIVHMSVDDHNFLIRQNCMLCMADNVSPPCYSGGHALHAAVMHVQHYECLQCTC